MGRAIWYSTGAPEGPGEERTMLDATRGDCVFHPNKPAVNRCKLCGALTCHNCTVTGPTGRFCSETCRDKSQAFSNVAAATTSRAPSLAFVRLRKLAGRLIVLAALLLAAGVVGTVFCIPVISELAAWARHIAGF